MGFLNVLLAADLVLLITIIAQNAILEFSTPDLQGKNQQAAQRSLSMFSVNGNGKLVFEMFTAGKWHSWEIEGIASVNHETNGPQEFPGSG